MKLGVWLYLIMVVAGVVSYYCSEPLMLLMPQDKDGNITWQYSFVPVLMDTGGLGLAFFGLLYASSLCETELIKRHKQLELNQKEEKENGNSQKLRNARNSSTHSRHNDSNRHATGSSNSNH